MNDFDSIQALGTYDHFTVFEAFSKSHQFPVVVTKCEYSRIEEAEFFIRSALMKTKSGVYSQILVSIVADIDQETGKMWIIFVWKKGKALDTVIERDKESLFPPGNRGYDNFRRITKNPNTRASIDRAQCLTIGKEIIIKKFKSDDLLNMNLVFKEALAQAKCNHPNICEFFDFRLFFEKDGMFCVYIVMERLKQDLASEITKRKELSQTYEEEELIGVLQDVTAALLHGKFHGLAHRDIKPANILRGTQGLKITNFASTWLKGLLAETTKVQSSIPYMSPEAWETVDNPELLQKPFESDVFSLGMTMLHLAAMDLPPRTAIMSHRDLETLLQQSVHALTYSDEFKGLIIAMLRPAAEERPTLETVREDSIQASLSLQRTRRPSLESPHQHSPNSQGTKQQADELFEEGESYFHDGNYWKAAEMYAAADSIYSRLFPNDKCTAHNLKNWGFVLDEMGNYSEAVEKHAAAHFIYSRLPNDINTAHNLNNWGFALKNLGNYTEAVKRYAAAHSICSQLFPNDGDAANNLGIWGDALYNMGNYSNAEKKFAAADSIYSQLFPNDKDTANNLGIWGNALYHMGNYSEAVKKFAAADSIYSRLFLNDNNTAINLNNWGLTLKNMTNYSEAEGKYSAARAIYTLNKEEQNAQECDLFIAELQ